jgi:hypothetical protein
LGFQRCKGMDKITQKDIDWLLNLGNREKNASAGLKGPSGRKGVEVFRKLAIRMILSALALVFLVILPFILLIRVSVYLNIVQGFPGWVSLLGGMIVMILFFTLYIYLIFRNVENRKMVLKYSFWSIGSVVAGFCMFSLFYLSGVHAKSDSVRELYRSMHPVLRVAVSTVTLADGGLVITDIGREEADYVRMGMPVNSRSLHYRQENGYYHAVDIRTLDRGLIRNAALRLALNAMGFKTIRHTGTADHLHVELPVRG